MVYVRSKLIMSRRVSQGHCIYFSSSKQLVTMYSAVHEVKSQSKQISSINNWMRGQMAAKASCNY
jgi:hypothetical protein